MEGTFAVVRIQRFAESAEVTVEFSVQSDAQGPARTFRKIFLVPWVGASLSDYVITERAKVQAIDFLERGARLP